MNDLRKLLEDCWDKGWVDGFDFNPDKDDNVDRKSETITTILSELKETGMFKSGKFKLHSGEESDFKIDCDALTDADLFTLSEMAVKLVRPFGKVIGIPTGGERFANALSRHESSEHKNHLLIVDDVLTTGISMDKVYYENVMKFKSITGIVIFNRSQKEEPDWIYSLFTLNNYKDKPQSPSTEQPGARPKIICLCGSVRFAEQFHKYEFIFSVQGIIVLAPCAYNNDVQVSDPEAKKAFDKLHMAKIGMCDEVMVLNVGGYIGESTRNEINYATKVGKPIKYLEQ